MKQTMSVLKENNNFSINNTNNNNEININSNSPAAVAAATATDSSSSSSSCGVLNDNENHHPYAFHVSGPRNVSSPNWREIIKSSWYISLQDHLFSILFVFCFI